MDLRRGRSKWGGAALPPGPKLASQPSMLDPREERGGNLLTHGDGAMGVSRTSDRLLVVAQISPFSGVLHPRLTEGEAGSHAGEPHDMGGGEWGLGRRWVPWPEWPTAQAGEERGAGRGALSLGSPPILLKGYCI